MSPPTVNWPSPFEKIRWTEAFKQRAKFVTGDNGEAYTCTYKEDTVLVKPVYGNVPMGYLPLNLATTEQWLHEDSDPIYKSAMAEFISSDHPGVSVRAEWPKFSKVPLKTLERKFRDVGAPGIDIMMRDNAVFLVKKAFK